MQETRIIKLNSKEGYAYDQKWETRLDIQNIQGLIDFYGILGFEIDQMERTKLENINTIWLHNSSSKSGLTPFSFKTSVDETLVVFKRQIKDDYDLSIEEKYFALKNEKRQKLIDIDKKYNFWINLSFIAILIIYGIPAFIILTRKSKKEKEKIIEEYDPLIKDAYNGLIEYCNRIKMS